MHTTAKVQEQLLDESVYLEVLAKGGEARVLVVLGLAVLHVEVICPLPQQQFAGLLLKVDSQPTDRGEAEQSVRPREGIA
jgi:hypothetical protein